MSQRREKVRCWGKEVERTVAVDRHLGSAINGGI